MKLAIGITGLIVAALVVFSGHAHAAAIIDKGDNKVIMFDTNGKRLSPLEANRLGESGEPVLACKLQDYVCNERTGKCALKAAR